jgi:hypothetical protein
MAEITYFAAMAFDFIDGDLVAGEPIDCPSPAVAIQTAQGQWKVFGHAGAIAFSRTMCFADLGRCRTRFALDPGRPCARTSLQFDY